MHTHALVLQSLRGGRLPTAILVRSAAVRLAAFLLTFCALAHSPAVARDWFVRSGTEAGEGSRARPFNDPWRALERCEAGDRIHIAGGSYFGKLGTGTWEIPFDRVELMGGYDAKFTTRDPWRNPTQLCWNATSQNWPKTARLRSQRRDVVVDGLVIDMQDQNAYSDDEKSGRTERPGETAMHFTARATIRHCVIINPGLFAIDAAAGSTIENNLILNPIMWGIVVSGAVTGVDRATATIRRNTIAFAWDTQKAGAGGYGGAAVALRAPAVVADNILAHCDNSAIYAVVAPAHVSVTGNHFWKNRFANLTSEQGAQRAVIGDADLELLEDVGLARKEGNSVGDPRLAFDASWLERTSKREREPVNAPPATPKPMAWGPPQRLEMTKGVAPACQLPMALGLVLPRETPATAGARRVDLAAPTFAGDAPETARAYEACQLTDWNRTPARKSSKPVAMVVAIAGVANTSGMPAAYPPSEIAGVYLFDPDGKGERVTGFFRKGSTADRVCNDAVGYYQGRGKPDRLHLVRGIAHEVAGVVKGAIYIESIERHEPTVAAAGSRPRGRDWFVRAGSSGGDGSREKPFRDPFQALERCEAGDTIHVAGGDYTGRLKGGRWTIGMPHVALLGGYDEAFSARAPWRHPTRLFCPPDFQGRRGGYTLEGANDHTGAVVDGFVFDKRDNNLYASDGELDVGRSDKTEHLWLSRPGCVVRNCVFVNGALGAVRAANGQTFENNVFVNHVTQTVWVESGHTTAPFVFRNNTALFGWTRRIAFGLGANGNLLRLGGAVHAVVENNLLAYADNDAIRLETDPRNVVLRGNVFARNLWSHVQQMNGWQSIDDRTFPQLADLGFRACEGNRIAEPTLAIDATWLALHQATRGPARITKAEPAAPARAPVPTSSGNPFDVGASAVSAPAVAAPPVATTNPFDESPPARPAGAPSEPFAPAYGWQSALKLFAADAAAGARTVALAVELTGITRVAETHDYTTTNWTKARDTDAWAALGGKRVALEVGVQRTDNQYFLPGVTAAEYDCYLVTGPAGIDSGGLPLRCYVRKGTQAQRVLSQAQDFLNGKPLELYVIKGVAKERRQLLVESVEKSR